MSNVIEYHKFVDIIDEGIMSLSIYEKKTKFSMVLKDELINILMLLSKAKSGKFDEVLHDKKFSIDKEDLKAINQGMSEVKFKEKDLLKAVGLLNVICDSGLTENELKTLEKILIDLSIPLWHQILIEN